MRGEVHGVKIFFNPFIFYFIITAMSAPTIAGIRKSTDDIPLHNRYFYRLIDRASAISPSSYFTDNVKPVSIKEAVIFFNPDEEMEHLFGRNKRLDRFVSFSNKHIKRKEYRGNNFLVNPINSIVIEGVYSQEKDALLYSNFGERFSGHNYLTLTGLGNLFIKDFAVLSYDLRLKENEGDRELEFYRYRVKKGFKHVSLIYAKDNLLFGPGHFGKLMLSRNVKPEEICMVKTEVPYDWGLLGKFRWYIWNIWYDDDLRAGHDPMMLGVRLSFRPFDEFEVNISRMSFYAQEYKKFKDYWHLFTAKYDNSGEAGDKWKTDQLVSLETSLYLPFLSRLSPFQGGKFYTEHTWNDFYGRWQKSDIIDEPGFIELIGMSYIYGLFLTTGRFDVRCEYVKTSRHYTTSNFSAEGYTDEGFLIGHYLEGDALGYFGEIYFEITKDTHICLNGGYISRGIHLDEQQIQKQYGGGIRYFPLKSLEVNFDVNYINRNKKDVNSSPIYYSFTDKEESDIFFSIDMVFWL
ncbi:MAG: capsule assembly Wzi family protein [bacterium]